MRWYRRLGVSAFPAVFVAVIAADWLGNEVTAAIVFGVPALFWFASRWPCPKCGNAYYRKADDNDACVGCGARFGVAFEMLRHVPGTRTAVW